MSGCIHVDPRYIFGPAIRKPNLRHPSQRCPIRLPLRLPQKIFISEIHDMFLSLISPLTQVKSFYATSTYAILDAETADDGCTCLLVTDCSGNLESRRAECPVALLVTVAAEMGMVGLGHAND